MLKTLPFTSETKELIKKQLDKGQFQSAEDVVRAGVEMLERHQDHLAELYHQIESMVADQPRDQFARYRSASEVASDLMDTIPVRKQRS